MNFNFFTPPPLIDTNYYKLKDEKNPTFAAIKFQLECCHKLELKQTTFSRAASIFHRFYQNIDRVDYDEFAIASAAIFLASKVSEENIRLKDLINVTQFTLDKEEWNNEVTNDEWVLSVRDTIVQCEMFIMRTLHFSPASELPHFFLLNYLSTLDNWLPSEVTSQISLNKFAISMLQDFYFSPFVVRYKPEDIATSILFLVFQIYGINIPLMNMVQDKWYTSLNPLNIETIWEIIDAVMDVYDKE